ncbi:MAG: AGE family epimerase/isomerase, partial [Burkholderiales bacterium]
PMNTAKRLYSQAFAIFGLAHAYRVTRDERYLLAAKSVWKPVRLLMHEPSGGFVAQSDRLFVKHGSARSQNPIMHLFEALLAMHDATSDPEWLRHARDIADFVLTRLMQKPSEDHRSIPEYYEADWKPQPSSRGGYIDLGHQAEWAWLLSAAAERGLPAYYIDIGGKLLDYAIASGYDRDRGGLYWRINDKGNVTRTKIWWVQSEFLRAALRYEVAHGRTALRALYDQTLGYVRAEFLDKEHGGWTPRPKSQCVKDTCKHQADVGYHIVGMHVDALRLSEMQAHPR